MINRLQTVLNSEIPLTNDIGIQVVESGENYLTLSAPLENNLNHKCTAFGGSLYSVAVLSGWGLLYLLMEKHHLKGHIVIQESHTKFIKPVTSQITATATFDSAEQYERLIKIFNRKGIARITLESKIICDSEVCVIFKGSYVLHS